MLRLLRLEGRGRPDGNGLTTAMPRGVIHTEPNRRRVPAHANVNATIRTMTRAATPKKVLFSSSGVELLGVRRSGMNGTSTGEVASSMLASVHCSMPMVRLLGLWAIWRNCADVISRWIAVVSLGSRRSVPLRQEFIPK